MYPPHFVETPDGLTHDLFQIVDDCWWAICGVELDREAPTYGQDLPEGLTRCDSCEGLRAAEADQEPDPDVVTPEMRQAAREAKVAAQG